MPATLGVVGGFALMRVLDNAFTLLALNRDGAVDGDPLPSHVQREFRRHLEWGILAHGFAGARLGERGHDFLIALSCKGRGVCPSCNTRRMVETAAHLADNVFPRLPARQWALAVPRRLRYFLHCDAVLQGAALRLFLHAAMTALAVPAVTTPAAPPVSPLSRFSTAASGAPSCLEWVDRCRSGQQNHLPVLDTRSLETFRLPKRRPQKVSTQTYEQVVTATRALLADYYGLSWIVEVQK